MNTLKTVSTALVFVISNASVAMSGQISVINPAAGAGLGGTPVVSSPPPIAPSIGAPSGAAQSTQARRIETFGRNTSILQRLSSIDTSNFTYTQRREAIAILSSLLNDAIVSGEIRQYLEAELRRLKP
jgi:hypothetical protein